MNSPLAAPPHPSAPLLPLSGGPAKAHELTARALLVTLARRCQLLMDTQLGPGAPQLDFAALAAQAEAIRLDASGLRWFNWARYSSRQRQAMNLGGLLGTLHLHGQQPDGLAAAPGPVAARRQGNHLRPGPLCADRTGRCSIREATRGPCLRSAIAIAANALRAALLDSECVQRCRAPP